MKKLIIGLSAIMLSTASLTTFAQTKDDAGQALNEGIQLKDTDVNAAIAKFNDCIKICEQVGVEADDIKSQAEKVLPGLHFQSAMELYKAKKLSNAIAEFEKRYLQKALIENNHNIAIVARKIKLRYETLHRKLRSLGLI